MLPPFRMPSYATLYYQYCTVTAARLTHYATCPLTAAYRRHAPITYRHLPATWLRAAPLPAMTFDSA